MDNAIVANRESFKGVKETVEFLHEGEMIRGVFFRPADVEGLLPTVVLGNGWGMVATGGDMEDCAAVVANRGFGVLVFDYRGLGLSDGLPRQEIDPFKQVDDFRAAISYVRSRADVDRERIGIWGTSYGGGHALVVAALDKRVKCVVSQVPTISGFRAAQRRAPHEKAKALQAQFEADREARFAGELPARLTTVSEDSQAAVVYPGRDSFDYMAGEGKRSPSWVNEVTLRSIELARAYEPGVYIKRIAPVPLLMIIANDDALTPPDLQQEAFAEAYYPKELRVVAGGHYSVYREHFKETSEAAAAWFNQYL